ncbi:hypothetical protein PENSPDRAFT_683575 [Peniophora sp. CONT]|nr:hypothetical protein PENSPDRAFT_683575 [Peniophora sp. CONT]
MDTPNGSVGATLGVSLSQVPLSDDIPNTAPVCIGQVNAPVLVTQIANYLHSGPGGEDWAPVVLRTDWKDATITHHAVYFDIPSSQTSPPPSSVREVAVLEAHVAQVVGPMLAESLVKFETCRVKRGIPGSLVLSLEMRMLTPKGNIPTIAAILKSKNLLLDHPRIQIPDTPYHNLHDPPPQGWGQQSARPYKTLLQSGDTIMGYEAHETLNSRRRRVRRSIISRPETDGKVVASVIPRVTEPRPSTTPPQRIIVKRSASQDSEPDLSSDQAAKRPRLQSQSSQVADLKRHDQFWYDDGGVVIQFGRTIFRLYKALLVKQSTFFRALVSGDTGQLANDYDTGNAVLPLYALSVDGLRFNDFTALLSALENPMQLHVERAEWDELAAIARAAKVLGFESMHAWAAEEIFYHWPDSIHLLEPTPCWPALAKEALQLSRDANIASIRKRALYELMRAPRFGHEDGDARPLIAADHNILVHAREKCTKVWMEVLLVPPPRGQRCRSSCPSRSDAMARQAWSAVVEKVSLRDYLHDPIRGYEVLHKMDFEDKGGLCGPCYTSWQTTWGEKRRELWDEQLDRWLKGSQ